MFLPIDSSDGGSFVSATDLEAELVESFPPQVRESLCFPPRVPGLWTRSALDRSPLQDVRCRDRGSSSLGGAQ